MIDIFKSSKEEEQIIFDNNVFSKHRSTRVYQIWRCQLRICTSSGQTLLEYNNTSVSTMKTEHNHPPQTLLCKKKKSIVKMKNLLLESGLPPNQVINNILRGADPETIESLIPFSNVCRLLRDYKVKKINPKPYLYPEIKLSENLCFTYSGEEFYRYGKGKDQEITEYNENLIFF